MLTHAAAVVPINVVNCEAPWLIGEPGGLASSHHNHLQTISSFLNTQHGTTKHITTHNIAQYNTTQGLLTPRSRAGVHPSAGQISGLEKVRRLHKYGSLSRPQPPAQLYMHIILFFT